MSLFTKNTLRSIFTKIMKMLFLFYPISFLFSTIIHSYLSLLKVVNCQPMKELVICKTHSSPMVAERMKRKMNVH